jgi:hypothetical protein
MSRPDSGGSCAQLHHITSRPDSGGSCAQLHHVMRRPESGGSFAQLHHHVMRRPDSGGSCAQLHHVIVRPDSGGSCAQLHHHIMRPESGGSCAQVHHRVMGRLDSGGSCAQFRVRCDLSERSGTFASCRACGLPRAWYQLAHCRLSLPCLCIREFLPLEPLTTPSVPRDRTASGGWSLSAPTMTVIPAEVKYTASQLRPPPPRILWTASWLLVSCISLRTPSAAVSKCGYLRMLGHSE